MYVGIPEEREEKEMQEDKSQPPLAPQQYASEADSLDKIYRAITEDNSDQTPKP